MKTAFSYLDDTYKFKDNATISMVDNDEKGKYLILDHTIFYPQGGGQASDIGTIAKDNNIIKINFVGFSDGYVKHYYNGDDSSFNIGDKVELNIDEKNRIDNSKSHTAGHLVQCIIEKQSKTMIATKGYHFPNGSYVEFEGEKPEDIESFLKNVNLELNDLIIKGVNINKKLVSYDELVNLSNNIPEGLPKDKPLRVIFIEGTDKYVPCGGTHLKNTNEFKEIKVRKLSSKKGKLKASYTFI